LAYNEREDDLKSQSYFHKKYNQLD
jgi:hypothetical protein